MSDHLRATAPVRAAASQSQSGTELRSLGRDPLAVCLHAGVLVLVAACWAVVAWRIGMGSDAEAATPGGPWLAAAVSLGFAFWALEAWYRSMTIQGGDDGVPLVCQRSLVPGSRWREPASHYRAVLHRIEHVPHRYGPRKLHVIELDHVDPRCALIICRERDEVRALALRDSCAASLRLPVINAAPPTWQPVPGWQSRPRLAADQLPLPV